MAHSHSRLPLFPAFPAPRDSNAVLVDSGAGTAEDERFMQVGDLAKESGKTVRAIHLYEELDLLRPAARSKGRYRLYGREALLRIRWIGKLQELGFSLTDIQEIVRDFERTESASFAMKRVREVYEKKLEETRAHVARLLKLEGEIVKSLDYLATCSDTCDPGRLHASCESCSHHEPKAEVPDLVAGFRRASPHA